MDPSNLNCSQVGSLEYRRLCQTLSLSPALNRRLSSTFTGNPATDILILQELPDENLTSVCSVDNYINNLCNNESFWLNRTLDRYGDQLGSGIEIKEKYIPDGTSWKEYYIWLAGLLEGSPEAAAVIANDHNRDDLKILLGLEDAPPSAPSGLKIPVYINDNLRGFLSEGNFGPSDPSNPWSVPLKDYISAVSTGISTREMLTGLFSFYIKVNKLLNKGVISTDPLMYKWFGDTFNTIKSSDPSFDPKQFKYNKVSKITRFNIISSANLSLEQQAALTSQDLLNRLDAETNLISQVINYGRGKK